MIGRRLSHYDIVDEISRGGMGVVYRAIDVHLGREIALKVLPEDLVHDSARRERLLQEARAASALEHPHVAVIHEVGNADGITFIAMELIRGEQLSDTLSRGPLSQARALALATEVAEGLARAHEKGIVHRDIKPANVMVTEEGHAKVIDFGLAKPFERISGDAATASMHAPLTNQGIVLGTAAYMSPEQARGARVDHRSDIFALGVTLYEMVTGRPAFQGQSSLDTMQAILTRPVPPLPSVAGSSTEITGELQRIISKCTAKDADDRYQGMKDLVVDLRATRRRLESAQTSTVAAPPLTEHAVLGFRRRSTRRLLLAGLAVVAAGAGIWWWTKSPSPPQAAGPSGKPAVAVLYFENNTGDRSLDWMRTGLTDMMVTDLSQSPDIEVLGTDRLVKILQELRRDEDRVVSADLVQAIASRAAVDRVLVGSYVRAGDTIRISARLQDARTGRIVGAERVEGAGESSIFKLVDELTRRFKLKITEHGGGRAGGILVRPGDAVQGDLDRGVVDVTTSSIEAFKYYAEGINFHERGLSSQAAPLLEKAIEIDPNFAMAYAKLAVVYGNLVRLDKRDAYAQRAIELSSRLTTRERYYIEGFYYSNSPDTLGQAIAAYQKCLELHPEHESARHNLGVLFLELDRFPEALQQFEELIRRGTTTPTSYENLVEVLIRTDNVVRAREIAEEFSAHHPDSSVGLRMLGGALIAAGRLDDARSAFEKSTAVDALDFGARIGQRSVAIQQARWGDAAAVDRVFAQSQSPFERFLSAIGEATIAAAHGQGDAAVSWLDRAARIDGLAPVPRAAARNRSAQMLLRAGRPAVALGQAELALADARGRDPEFETLRLLAIAQARVGRHADSEKTIAQLTARAKALPGEAEMRGVHWARGEIALARGDAAAAATELGTAVASLSVHGPVLGPPSPHPDLWYTAALAFVKAGRDADAVPLLDRLTSWYERVYAMDDYARGLYLLAEIHERRGEGARAREQYARFVDLWRDGDLNPDWVAEAEKKLR
jgi:tetratricopeptide (TPR) repeat protein/TolB-like protein/predicted Ser/Thr protein kinase